MQNHGFSDEVSFFKDFTKEKEEEVNKVLHDYGKESPEYADYLISVLSGLEMIQEEWLFVRRDWSTN